MSRLEDALLILQKAQLEICDAFHIPQHHWQPVAAHALGQHRAEYRNVRNLKREQKQSAGTVLRCRQGSHPYYCAKGVPDAHARAQAGRRGHSRLL